MAFNRRTHIKAKINRASSSKSLFLNSKFWLLIFLVITALAASYFVIFYKDFQVNKIIISGNDKIDTKYIESLIESNVNKRILSIAGPSGSWEVVSRSIFLLNPEKLKGQLLKEFPVIESVEVIRKFMQTIEVNLKERVPVAIFCEEDCFFTDKNGTAFEPLFVMPQNMVIVRQSAKLEDIIVGKEVIHKNIMDLILDTEKNLKDNFKISIKEALITTPTRLNIKTSEGWKIYLDIYPDSKESSQSTKLNLLLTTGIPPEQRKNLRYIDLRPKDKAIVCDNNTCGAGQ
jgi:cell division septal protein FtsQ